MGEQIVIHVSTGSDSRPKHPCDVGQHRWAWCQRVDGSTIMRCATCGKERR